MVENPHFSFSAAPIKGAAMHPEAYAALKRPEALSVSSGQLSPIMASNCMASIISESKGTKMPAAERPKMEMPIIVRP